jgi:hypothetical protein
MFTTSPFAFCQLSAALIDRLSRTAYTPRILALAGFALLSGCIDSAEPMFFDAQPLLGTQPQLEFFALRDGAAHEPETATFAWRNSRYVPIRGTAKDI